MINIKPIAIIVQLGYGNGRWEELAMSPDEDELKDFIYGITAYTDIGEEHPDYPGLRRITARPSLYSQN